MRRCVDKTPTARTGKSPHSHWQSVLSWAPPQVLLRGGRRISSQSSGTVESSPSKVRIVPSRLCPLCDSPKLHASKEDDDAPSRETIETVAAENDAFDDAYLRARRVRRVSGHPSESRGRGGHA